MRRFLGTLTIIIFTFMQLQGCASVNSTHSMNSAYSTQHTSTNKAEKAPGHSSKINPAIVILGVGAVVVGVYFAAAAIAASHANAALAALAPK